MRDMRPEISAEITTDSFGAKVPTARMSSVTVSIDTGAASMATPAGWPRAAVPDGVPGDEVADVETSFRKTQLPTATSRRAPIADQKTPLLRIWTFFPSFARFVHIAATYHKKTGGT